MGRRREEDRYAKRVNALDLAGLSREVAMISCWQLELRKKGFQRLVSATLDKAQRFVRLTLCLEAELKMGLPDKELVGWALYRMKAVMRGWTEVADAIRSFALRALELCRQMKRNGRFSMFTLPTDVELSLDDLIGTPASA